MEISKFGVLKSLEVLGKNTISLEQELANVKNNEIRLLEKLEEVRRDYLFVKGSVDNLERQLANEQGRAQGLLVENERLKEEHMRVLQIMEENQRSQIERIRKEYESTILTLCSERDQANNLLNKILPSEPAMARSILPIDD